MHVIFCTFAIEQHLEPLANAHGWELGQLANNWQEALLAKQTQKKAKTTKTNSLFLSESKQTTISFDILQCIFSGSCLSNGGQDSREAAWIHKTTLVVQQKVCAIKIRIAPMAKLNFKQSTNMSWKTLWSKNNKKLLKWNPTSYTSIIQICIYVFKLPNHQKILTPFDLLRSI